MICSGTGMGETAGVINFECIAIWRYEKEM